MREQAGGGLTKRYMGYICICKYMSKKHQLHTAVFVFVSSPKKATHAVCVCGLCCRKLWFDRGTKTLPPLKNQAREPKKTLTSEKNTYVKNPEA